MSLTQFHQQVERLLSLGYPKLLGVPPRQFEEALQPLAKYLPNGSDAVVDVSRGTASYVLVINSLLAPVETTLPLVTRRQKPAIEHLYPKKPDEFVPIESIRLPEGDAYLLLDIDRGSDTLNVTPNAAYESITAQGRSPLTIAEGVALLTHFPEFLQPNQCFSLLASRCGDKRVPALWLSEGRPKLGWCWAGNPHTWLGSASCAQRIGSIRMPASAGNCC